MTTFPAFTPNTINFDLGQSNVSEVETFAGPIRFRHSGRINGHTLQITYVGLNQSNVDALRTHYYASQGTHNTFTVPATIWGGLSVVQSSSVYRYLGPPEEKHTGIHYDVTISLRVTDGLDFVLVLNGGVALPQNVEPFQSFAFTGNAPFILNAGGSTPTYILQGRGASQ